MAEEHAARWDEVFKELRVGDVVTGTVSSLASYGAFVELGGAYGLVHVSELSQDPVRRVEDLLHPGDRVTAKVVRLDPERNQVILSLRQAD